jgi:Tfp pilus assembly protein PilV
VILTHGSHARSGVSLLESLIAAAIFFMAFAAINQLLDLAGQQAIAIRERSLAAQLAQSKLNEVVAGALPLSGQSGSFDELPDWEWSVESSQHSVTGLWAVRVQVWHNGGNPANAISLDQLVLDPSKRGSTMDQAAISGSDTQGTDSTSGQSGSTGSSPSSGGSSQPSGGGSQPSGGGSQPSGGGSQPSGGSSQPSGGGSRPSGGGSGGSGGSRPSGR